LLLTWNTGYDFNDNKDMDSLIKVLDDITLVMIPKCEEQYNRVIGIYGKPSLLTRYWAPLTLLYFGGNVTVKYVSRQQDNIKIWLNEAVETAQDFAIHWLWEPMLKVWDTIRMKDQQLALLSKEGLRSDMEVSYHVFSRHVTAISTTHLTSRTSCLC
jgi:ATP synthase regulation protein NCA2